MISMKPSKKRKLLTTPAAKARRLAYKLEQKNPAVARKRAKTAKAYYKKNRNQLLRKAAITRKARSA